MIDAFGTLKTFSYSLDVKQRNNIITGSIAHSAKRRYIKVTQRTILRFSAP